MRPEGGTGRRRLIALVVCLYVAAGAAATWPAVKHAGSAFLAQGLPGHGEAAPGDHLQTAYRLWLPGRQIEHVRAPWLDPYSFQPEVDPRINFSAWPFGLPFWPLQRSFGTVKAWNAFVLLSYLAAGALTYLWLRRLELHVGAALAGGLAFALAPYLVAQSAAGHLLAPVAMVLLPLTLWAIERGWAPLAVAALVSIPLSGQLHLALWALPFVLIYAGCRGRVGSGGFAFVLAVAAGLLVWIATVRGSVGAGGRSFAQVERYSAELADFASRDVRHGIESFVFLGWAVPLLAVAGLVVLVVDAKYGLAFALGLGAIVALVLALGSHLPGYESVWRHVPGFRDTRVPERLMPVACLCLAGLAAFAVARIPWPLVAGAVAVVAVAVDLRAGVEMYRPTGADEGNKAYAALAKQPKGRLLELPVFLPDRQEGSVYLYYAMQAPRERPLGYSTTAPPEADALARRLLALSCGAARPAALTAAARRLGVRYLAVHRGLRGCAPRRLPGWRPLASAGPIQILRLR